MSDVRALYVHVPYCVRKCAYCDFESRAVRAGASRLAAYAKDMLRQLRMASDAGLLGGCRTAYVGGGTPTLLGAEPLEHLVATIRELCPHLHELTCEANPESLSDKVLAALLRAGATRLSVGVQSLDDDELYALGRVHTAGQARDRVRAACQTGLDVSVDLMCAIPLQTDASWRQTLREIVDLGLDHVSVYPLVIEEGTAFARRYGDVVTPWNDEDVQAERMELAECVLEEAGLLRYEVASYARPGKECQHNTAYWTGVPYIGLGRGAASMLDQESYALARQLYDWLPEPPAHASRMRFSTLDTDVEFLSAREAWAEDLMLGMRLTRGIDESQLDAAPTVRDELLARGLVTRERGRLIPTHDGWLLGNELFGALWGLADDGL